MQLVQFQCQIEGSLFYYPAQNSQYAKAVVSQCPVCGSELIETTGRVLSNPEWTDQGF